MSKDSREATESAAGAALRMARAELIPQGRNSLSMHKAIRKATESAAARLCECAG